MDFKQLTAIFLKDLSNSRIRIGHKTVNDWHESQSEYTQFTLEFCVTKADIETYMKCQEKKTLKHKVHSQQCLALQNFSWNVLQIQIKYLNSSQAPIYDYSKVHMKLLQKKKHKIYSTCLYDKQYELLPADIEFRLIYGKNNTLHEMITPRIAHQLHFVGSTLEEKLRGMWYKGWLIDIVLPKKYRYQKHFFLTIPNDHDIQLLWIKYFKMHFMVVFNECYIA